MRRRRGLSRQALAGLVGYSAEWLRQVEKDERRLDKLSTLMRVADVLRVDDVSGFLGVAMAPSPRTARLPGAAPAPIRQAMLGSPDGEFGPACPGELGERLGAAWLMWQEASRRYSLTRQNLPWLLAGVARESCDEEASRLAAHVYRLAAAFLRSVGDRPLALLASERSVIAGARTGDALAGAVCAGGLASTLLALGFPEEAGERCRAAIAVLSPDVPDAPEAISVWGAVHLTAAEAEAARDEHLAAHELLDRARAAADRLDADRNDLGSCFGPTDVSVHEVRVEVVLGRMRRALRLATKVDVGTMCKERQARHYITLARAHARERDSPAATFALLQAEQACAEEIVHNAEAHEIIQTVLRQDNATVRREMWKLAERAGLL